MSVSRISNHVLRLIIVSNQIHDMQILTHIVLSNFDVQVTASQQSTVVPRSKIRQTNTAPSPPTRPFTGASYFQLYPRTAFELYQGAEGLFA